MTTTAISPFAAGSSPTRSLENRITRRVLSRRSRDVADGLEEGTPADNPWARRLIAVLAVFAGLTLAGAWLQELLWFAVALATAIAIAKK